MIGPFFLALGVLQQWQMAVQADFSLAHVGNSSSETAPPPDIAAECSESATIVCASAQPATAGLGQAHFRPKRPRTSMDQISPLKQCYSSFYTAYDEFCCYLRLVPSL